MTFSPPSLKWRIVVLLLTVSLLPLGLVAFGAWAVFGRMIEQRALDLQQNVVRNHAQAIDSYLEQRIHLLQLVAATHSMREIAAEDSLIKAFAGLNLASDRGFVDLGVIRDKSVDAVVLDVKMPGMDGTETFGHIKRIRPGLPVIIFTGHASISHAFDMSAAGVFHYMSKPVDIEQLADKCREAAQMRKARRDAAHEAGDTPIAENGLVKILLVDDERDLLDTLQRVLRRRGMEVYIAESGEQGLRTILITPIDIVILDVRMPGIDGLEVLRRIKRDHVDIEVILLTGHPTVDEAKEGIRQGAIEYLIKPPDIKALTDLIRKAFNKRCEALARKQQELIEEILGRIPG